MAPRRASLAFYEGRELAPSTLTPARGRTMTLLARRSAWRPRRSISRRYGGAVRRGRRRDSPARWSTLPYLTRTLPPVEVISTEGLEAIEHNADTLLQEVGIEIVNYPEAVEIFRGAGADVQGTRVRFERGMCRKIVQATAPRSFTQTARNPARSVVIGDPHMVLVPTYGSPFIHNLDDGRRYATIEDFRNFVKLTYTSTTLHHGGGTLCEPVDLPVNKRHFEMVYSHIRYTDRRSWAR